MTAPELPRTLRTLILRLAPGWTANTTHAHGPCQFSYYGDERSDGTRPTLTRVEEVDSVLVRLCHHDGRAAVALWVKRPGDDDKGKPHTYQFDLAWRGRHDADGEGAPQQLTAEQLAAYAASTDLVDYRARLDALAARKAEQAAARAARKAATRLPAPHTIDVHLPEETAA